MMGPRVAQPDPRDGQGPVFPRAVLFGAAALIGFSILLAAVGRLRHATDIPPGTALQVRDLRFADLADGDVRVTDATTGAVVATISGQAGFLRGTMRGLAQARERAGIGAAPPFRLTAWQDGRLTLDDPATGRHIELEAFGHTNEAAFAILLPPAGPAP